MKKDIVMDIMNEGGELIKNEKIKKVVKKSSPKEIQKIVNDTKKLTPEKPIKEETIKELEEKSPEINFEISEVTRYDINWFFLRKKLLEVMRLFSYKNYEKWFNESFNNSKTDVLLNEKIENERLKNELIEGLKPENSLPDEWLNVEPDEINKMLKIFPSLNIKPIENKKEIEKIFQMKTGEDFIDLLKRNNNTKEQTREFLIKEIHRLENESDLMKRELLNTVIFEPENEIDDSIKLPQIYESDK